MSYNKNTKMYEGYIYCIENLVNGKKYIGYTKNDIDTRWKQHLSKTHHKEDHSILHLAIDKYKECNFIIYPIRVLQSCTSDDLLKQLQLQEKECVKQYNTISPNGYNILQGGEAVPINRITPVYQYTMNGDFVASFKSITEAIQLNGLDDDPKNSKLARHLRTDHCSFGYLWNTNSEENVVGLYNSYMERKNNRSKRKSDHVRHTRRQRNIFQYNNKGELMCQYTSAQQASDSTGFSRTTIEKHIKGIIESVKIPYTWSDKALDVEQIKNRFLKCERKVYQYTLDGKLIQIFNSLREAGKSIGDGYQYQQIGKCCCKRIAQAYGYIWNYEE
jgi:group I intron endonuclease